MRNKPLLLILTPGFPDGEKDSKCIPAMQLFLAELQQRERFEIKVISFHYPYQRIHYNWQGIEVFALGGDNKKGLKRMMLWREVLKRAQLIHQSKPIQLIHSFWLGECALLGNKLADRFAVRHSCTLMGQDVLPSNRFLRRLKKMPTLIALSEFQIKHLGESIDKGVIHLIPWGLEKLEMNSQHREIDVIGVGWLNEVKAFNRFVEIIFELRKVMPTIKAEIIGEGENAEELKHQIDGLDLTENLKLIGSLEREETIQKIANAKVLLHTSSFESFGLVFLEALACGTKIISTEVGIAPEIKVIHTASSNQAFVQAIAQYLKQGTAPKAQIPYSIKQTVDSYLNSVFLTSNKRD